MADTIEIYGVPMDLGANARGVDMGPSALRIAGIAESLLRMGFEVSDRHLDDVKSRVALPTDDGSARYVEEIAAVCGRLCELGHGALTRGATPVFLGGDHSIAAGTIAGSAAWARERGEHVGVIWFDAHTDMNTPDTSPSGNVHGMPLSALLGHGDPSMCAVGFEGAKIRPENVYVIGARAVDPTEKALVAETGIHVFTMTEIDRIGMAEVTRRAIEGAGSGTTGIHVSFDIDGLDPACAPGVGTPVRGGVNFREAHLMLEMIAESRKMMALDVVELNPVRDERNATAETVVHLVQSAFGRRIL